MFRNIRDFVGRLVAGKNGKPKGKKNIGTSLEIEASGSSNASAKSTEIWILEVIDKHGSSYSWDEFLMEGGFHRRSDPSAPLGDVLFTLGQGKISFPSYQEVARIRFLAHPWSGLVDIRIPSASLRVDLFREEAGDLFVDLETAFNEAPKVTSILGTSDFSEEQRSWIERVDEVKPLAIGVIHPEWRGIRSSTSQHLDSLLLVGDSLDVDQAANYARMIVETGCERVVFSGFALSHRYIVTALDRIAPNVKSFVLWHGNLLQTRENYNWRAYQAVVDLTHRGLIYKVGFVKDGMAEAHQKLLGIRSGFVLNFVDQIPNGPSKALEGGPHIGVWSLWSDNWRKPPYAMIVGAAQLQGAVLHGAHASQRLREFVRVMKLDMEFSGDPYPQNEMPAELAQMHLNLYITLTECAPMLPLESLAVGTPCLIGPTSHLFQDHEYLHARLVVPYPDRSDVITDYMRIALEERNEIIQAYMDYSPSYNRNAKASMLKFLELDLALLSE